MAAAATGCAIASFSLIDAQRQWVKAAHGITLREVPRAHSSAPTPSSARARWWCPTRADPRFRDNPFALADDGIRFYAGVPLLLDGCKLGTLW